MRKGDKTEIRRILGEIDKEIWDVNNLRNAVRKGLEKFNRRRK